MPTERQRALRGHRRVAALGAIALAVSLGLAGCGGGAGGSEGSGGSGSGTVTVLAAASLTEAFEALAETYRSEHPGVDLRLSFGPSSGLAQQVVAGAPADVFAAASDATMATVVDAGAAAGTPAVFATNRLAIVTPADSTRVGSLQDLAAPGVSVAVCQEQVPCGAATAEMLQRAGVPVEAATYEADVKAVLTKVTLGEVDAGVVYVTDARAAGDRVRVVDVPDDVNVTTSYPIAALAEAADPDAAADFVDLVLSEQGRAALAAAGFGSP
ncbi:MAG: molybdate ABC transporter substrate-binding protein [Candidatus Nanopelagicales bacterium]